MSRAAQFLTVAALLRERYESAPSWELPLLASFVAYLEALADQEEAAARAAAPGVASALALPAAAASPAAPPSPAAAACAPPASLPGAAPAGLPSTGSSPLPPAGACAPAPLPPIEPPPVQDPGEGTFLEAGWGGIVITDTGQRQRIPYSVMVAAGLHHGDRVRLTRKPTDPEHYRYTRTGSTTPVDPVTIREVVADLQGSEGRWQAQIGGRPVRVRRGLQIDLVPGDVVTLRYSEADLGQPDGSAWVVRRHDVVEAGQPSPVRQPRTVVRRTVPRQAARARQSALSSRARETGTAAPPADQSPGQAPIARPWVAQPPLPRILIVGGHPRARRQYASALAHLADVEALPGTRLTRSLRDRLAHAHAVVVVTQHMSHTVSDHVIPELRARAIPSISARSQNRSGLVRQVEEELLPLLRRGGTEGGAGSDAGAARLSVRDAR